MDSPAVEPQPQDRLTRATDQLARGLAWATQLAAATTYLYVTAQPAAWQQALAKDTISTVLLWASFLTLMFLWASGLWAESQRYYDRRSQRLNRKAGLVGHAGVLIIAAAAASDQPHRGGLWIVLGVVAFGALATWTSWMQARFLPDEDQAVIDAIFAREAAQRAALHDASEREKRRIRLAAITKSLGYTLTEAPAETSTSAEAPLIKWTIPPGKHAPLVYFIRNGNRMKIGTTTELKRRIRTLALRQENVALLVAGDQRREREYHKQFAEHRIGRTEWFAYEGALAIYVHAETSRITQKGQQQ